MGNVYMSVETFEEILDRSRAKSKQIERLEAELAEATATIRKLRKTENEMASALQLAKFNYQDMVVAVKAFRQELEKQKNLYRELVHERETMQSELNFYKWRLRNSDDIPF